MTESAIPLFVSKMENAGLAPLVINSFSHYYQQLVAGESGLISDADIRPVAPEDVEDSAGLGAYAQAGKTASKRSGHRAFTLDCSTSRTMVGAVSGATSRTARNISSHGR